MKKLYAFSFALLSWATGKAQITIDQSSYPALVIAADTFGSIQGGAPSLDTGTNREWDFTGVAYENVKYYSEQMTATNPNLPNATWWERRSYKPGTLDSIRFQTRRWSGITPAGLMRIGEDMDRKAIWLGQFGGTFSAGDSLVILQQDVPYSPAYPLIKFPATYNSNWTAGFDFVVNMELTYANAGLNKAPFVYKSHIDYEFDIPGWGKALTKKFDGTLGEAEVLMERISGTTTDSFLLNGSPAPINILSSLGLTQNKVTNNYFDELFRINEVNALVLYLYGQDNTFQNVQSSQVQMLRLWPANVKAVSKDGSMSLYPNPVNGDRKLTIKLSNPPSTNSDYKITRIDGAVVSTGKFAASGKNELEILLPASITNGIYWLTLTNNEGKTQVAPFSFAE